MNTGLIIVALMQRYLGGLLDPFVTLLDVHKLTYFVQEAGEPLRFQCVKHRYGPYAENLRHVLKAVEGAKDNLYRVMSREGATQQESVERRVYDWNVRKRQFTPRQLAIAEERLRSQGWLSHEVASAH